MWVWIVVHNAVSLFFLFWLNNAISLSLVGRYKVLFLCKLYKFVLRFNGMTLFPLPMFHEMTLARFV